MKRFTIFSAVILALCSFSSSATAANVSDGMTHVWKRYLSPADQKALAAFAAAMPDEQQPAASADPAAMVASMRKGFEDLIATIEPLPSSIKRTPFAENEIRGVWFTPEGAEEDKVLLYFHGGGYVVGTADTAAPIAGILARNAGITCFSLDYPLAPEAPFPAATDNALAAYRMLLDKGFKPGHIVLSGDSAGGGLVLATLLNIRDKNLPMPAGAYLLSPWADLNQNAESYDRKKQVDVLVDKESLRTMSSLYANGQDINQPLLSPVFADLKDLSPLLIHVGSFETLLDDSLTIARNAALADVPVQLKAWPGNWHVFQFMHGELESGRKALQEGAEFFKAAIDKTLIN